MSDREMDHDAAPGPERTDGDVPAEEERWPIGFILTIVMVSVYLGYRLIQGVVLLFDWLL